jgi:hypothetical protein
MSSLLEGLWYALGPRIALLLLFVLLTTAGVVIARLRKPTLERWPTADGTVVSVNARSVDGDLGTLWFCDVSYSYSVSGEFYGGYRSFGAVSENEADTLAHSLRGKTILVHYSPKDPAESAVLREEQVALLGTPLHR